MADRDVDGAPRPARRRRWPTPASANRRVRTARITIGTSRKHRIELRRGPQADQGAGQHRSFARPGPQRAGRRTPSPADPSSRRRGRPAAATARRSPRHTVLRRRSAAVAAVTTSAHSRQQQRRQHAEHDELLTSSAGDGVHAAGQIGGQPHERAGQHRVLDGGVAVGHAADVEALVAPQRDDVGVAEVGVLLVAGPVAVGARRLLRVAQQQRQPASWRAATRSGVHHDRGVTPACRPQAPPMARAARHAVGSARLGSRRRGRRRRASAVRPHRAVRPRASPRHPGMSASRPRRAGGRGGRRTCAPRRCRVGPDLAPGGGRRGWSAPAARRRRRMSGGSPVGDGNAASGSAWLVGCGRRRCGRRARRRAAVGCDHLLGRQRQRRWPAGRCS